MFRIRTTNSLRILVITNLIKRKDLATLVVDLK